VETALNLFVGLDVSQKKTAVFLVDASGAKVCQATIDTSPQAIYDYLVERGLELAKVGMSS
jgi:transposase